MVKEPLTQRARRSVSNLRSDWIEIGGLGRLAVVGIVLAAAVTLVLGFSITRSARGHLLDARAAMVVAIVNELPPYPDSDESSFAAFDVAVRIKLVGGETVRVKVWAPDGKIVYSDADELEDQTFDLPRGAAVAFATGLDVGISDPSSPDNYLDSNQGELIDVFVSLPSESGPTAYVIEVEQDATGLTHALSQITRNVWISIGIGLVAIGLVMAVGIAARTREVNRRRRQAEGLLEASFKAQEQERTRVVSALHDDIGQPMYRLLYGLEGSRAKLDEDDPVGAELRNLAGVVREMDATLRNELRLLNYELAADAGLATALGDLAEITRAETNLEVDVQIDLSSEPSAVSRTEMYRAAREAIMNVRKHAEADIVVVKLYHRNNRLILDVTDDGTGFSGATNPGLGLSTTKQRFVALDGDVTIESVPWGGTRFSAWLPIGSVDR